MPTFTEQIRLDSSTGSEIVPFLSGDSTTGFYLQSLRAKIQCPSLPKADIPDLEPMLTRAQKIKIIRDLEWDSPRREVEVVQKVRDGDFLVLARISCLNRPPFYSLNALQLLTDNADLPVGADAVLGFRASDAGFGLPSGADEIVLYGGGVAEPVLESSEPAAAPGAKTGTTSLVAVSSTAIAVAPEQLGRKYLAVSVQSGGPVWLGLGSKPKVGMGILLTGKSSSYEQPNYWGVLYAIAEKPSTISVTLAA